MKCWVITAFVFTSMVTVVPAYAEEGAAATTSAPPIVREERRLRLDRAACCPPRCMPYETPCGPCCWHGEVTLAGWLSSLDGHATVLGRRSDVELDASDLIDAVLDHGDGVLEGAVRAWHGRWGFRVAGLTANFAAGAEFREGGARGIDAEAGMDLLQADVAYCLKKCPIETCGCPGSISYEAFAGIRYFNLEASIEPRGALPGASGSKDFVDPLVGARVTWDLGNRWVFDLEADIGGFGINSDLTWSLRGGARYRVTRWFSVELGYKALDIDYADGSGANRFEWDILFHGPYLALNFNW